MKHAVKHIHFVGVGGAGMSGIAEILHNLGYTVSGSDLADSPVSRRLAELGIRVFVGHAAENIFGAQAVVTSTAVSGDNPEVIAARANSAISRVTVGPARYCVMSTTRTPCRIGAMSILRTLSPRARTPLVR